VRLQAWTLAALLLASGWAARAQSTSATLKGTVRDKSDRPVADVFVQAQSDTSGMVRTAITDDDGLYQFVGLPTGRWMVVARAEDGGTSETRTITLSLQQNATLDLVVGSGLTESVTVTAESPILDPQQVGGKHSVQGEQADALPISSRNLTDLALLDASVKEAAAGGFYGERGAVFVLNGQSGRANSFLVDGLDNNDQTSGTAPTAHFAQQAIKEFVVLTHQYSPEFGRATGGIMNILTERGTNDLSAALFVEGGAANWSSSGDFVDSLPGEGQDTPNRFATGFTVGGPMVEDKAHYFLAYEHQQGNSILAYTGIDRDGRPGGWMVSPDRSDNVFLRMDVNLSQDNMLMFRLSGDNRESDGMNVGGIITPEASFRLEEQDFQLGASLTTIVSPQLLNEVRFLAGTSTFDQFANSPLSGVDRPGGVFGGNALGMQLRDETRFQILDNVTYRTGTHTLKFGLDLTHSRTNLDVRFNRNGGFLYGTDERFEAGDGYVFIANDCLGASGADEAPCPGVPGIDDDGDCVGPNCTPFGPCDPTTDEGCDEPADRSTYPTAFTLVRGDAVATLDDTRVALFVQDSWQASPSLLLDYGLRYDMSTYTLPEGASVDSTIPNGGAERDLDNIAPRFGFTYRPAGSERVVLRGGVGVFYDKFVLAFPAVAAVTSGTEIGLSPTQGFALEITEDTVEEQGIEFIEEYLFFPEQLTLRFSTGTELQTPHAVHANIGVEQAVGARGSWSANLVRVRGYNLPVMRDLNPVACFLNPGDHPADPCANPDTPEDEADLRRIPVHEDSSTGSIAAIVTEGESWYTGLDLAWKWFGKKNWFQASYTLSKSEDLGPDPLKGGIYLPPDSSNLQGERGRSDHDRRHRFVFSGDGPLPWWGMRLSGVLRVASGVPSNITTGTDDNLDGIKSDRPAGVGRNTGADTDLSAVNAIREEKGLPAVNRVEEPWLAQLDLRLSKPFSWSDGSRGGQLYLQIINVLDRENYALVEGRATSANFGRPIGLAGPPRTVELGMQVKF
jgi:hypothetical protein